MQIFFKYNYKNIIIYEKNVVYSYMCMQEKIFKIYVDGNTTFYIQQIINILLHFPEFANILACCMSTCYILYADSQCDELIKCNKIIIKQNMVAKEN